MKRNNYLDSARREPEIYSTAPVLSVICDVKDN